MGAIITLPIAIPVALLLVGALVAQCYRSALKKQLCIKLLHAQCLGVVDNPYRASVAFRLPSTQLATPIASATPEITPVSWHWVI